MNKKPKDMMDWLIGDYVATENTSQIRADERKKIAKWCRQRCEDNITVNGTDKWNSDLEDLLSYLSEQDKQK
jgi:hypothetical protein